MGLDASYQEVEIPPDWDLRADTLVLNRHVNASVDLGKVGEHVVDFNMASHPVPEQQEQERRPPHAPSVTSGSGRGTASDSPSRVTGVAPTTRTR